MAKFENPANGYIEEASSPLSWLWCLLFSWIYFMVKGNWKHAIILFVVWWLFWLPSLILLFIPQIVLHILYAFLVYKINDAYYLKKGWVKVSSEKNEAEKS